MSAPAHAQVVSDKYNFDDDNGNRIYSGSFGPRTMSSVANPGRLMISPFRYAIPSTRIPMPPGLNMPSGINVPEYAN